MLFLQYGNTKEGVLGACAVVFLSESSYSWSVSFPLLKSLCESLFVTLLISFLLPLSDNTMWVPYPCLCALNRMCVCVCAHTHVRVVLYAVQRCAMAADEWGIFFSIKMYNVHSWLRYLGMDFFLSSLLNSTPLWNFSNAASYTHLSMVLGMHYILWKTSHNDIGP